MPAHGSVLDDPPREISLEFSDSIFPVEIKLLDNDGLEVDELTFRDSSSNSVRIALEEELEPGGYLIKYRVVSSDSHPVAGSLSFAVRGADGAATLPIAASTSAEAKDTWLLITSYVIAALYNLCLLAAAGGVLFLLALSPSDRVTGLLLCSTRYLALAGLIFSLMTVGIEGAHLLGSGLRSILAIDAWRLGGKAGIGTSSAAAVLGFVFVLVGTRFHSSATPRWVMLGIAGVVLLCASQAMSGHPVSGDLQWLLISAIIVHILFIAFWFGALMPLYATVRTDSNAEAAAILEKFSRTASIAVALLFAAGLAMSWVHVQKLENLWSSDYGLILTVKLLLFFLLVILALLNRIRFTAGLARGDVSAATALKRSIAAEFVVIVTIVAISGVLASTSPPRALSAVKEIPTISQIAFEKDVSANGYRGRLEWRPESPGISNVLFRLDEAGGGVASPQEVRLELYLPDRGIEPMHYGLELAQDGLFSTNIPSLTVPGQWIVNIDVLVDDFNKVTFETTLEVP